MREHDLKCWSEYFKAVESGEKPFEVRKFDRPYAVGDTLLLREYDLKAGDYTGREVRREISYLLDLTYLPGADRPIYGGYVALGLRRPAPENKAMTCEGCKYSYRDGTHGDIDSYCQYCARMPYADRYAPVNPDPVGSEAVKELSERFNKKHEKLMRSLAKGEWTEEE